MPSILRHEAGRVTMNSMASNSREPLKFKAGEPLFREGDHAKSMYLIKMGKVSVRRSVVTGGQIEINQIGTNQIVGELSFFDRKPRSADAVALTSVEAIEIPFTAIDPMFKPAPDYMKKIITALAVRLREANDIIHELKIRLGDTASEIKSLEPQDDLAKTLEVLAMTNAEAEKKS